MKDKKFKVLSKQKIKLSEVFDILNRSPAVAFLWKNEEGWPVEYVSDNVERLTGYSEQEFMEGKISYIDIIHSDDLKRVKGEVTRYSKEKGLQTFKHEPYRIIAKNKDIKWVEDITYIRRDSNGKITHYEGIVFDISKRKLAEENIQHINIVLQTIRKINQLIVTEKNRDVLIQKVCEILIENYGYDNAWIVLLGKDGEYLNHAKAGLGKKFSLMKKMLGEGKLPDCGKRTLKKSDLVIIEEPHKECLDCPLSQYYAEQGGYSICIKHDSTIFGLLTVSVPRSFLNDKTEQNLFREVSEDLGFALNSIEVEKKHKQAVDDLKKQKEFSEKIINTSNAIIIGLDIDHKIRLFNEGAEKITGYNRKYIIGKDWFEIFVPSELRGEINEVWQNAWGKKFHSYINPIQLKSGGKRIISWQSTGLYEGKDEKDHLLISIGEDITERKRKEAELLVKNEVFEAAITANSISDNEGILTYVNNAFIKIFGYKNREEAIGKPISDFLKFENEAMNIITELNKSGVWEGEYTGLRKDGTTYNAYGLATIIRDKFGDSIGYQSAVMDISDRKRMEEILKIERDNLKNIFETIEDGIYIVNRQYDILYVNPVLTKDFGIYEGRKCYEYFRDRKNSCPWCKNSEVFAGKTVRWEWFSSKNGKTYDLIDTPLKNPDGSISKLEIFRDITERKKAEEEILKLKNGLEIQVAEKTKELNEKISELERFFDATIEREFRIKELNDRIEELEVEVKKYGKT